MRTLCVSGTFLLIVLTMKVDFTLCREPVQDFVEHVMSECHFTNGTEKVRLLERYFYNQEEFVYFDSDIGEFIAKTEFGRPTAEYWNKNKELIEQKRASVETFCKYDYEILHSVTADRRVEPTVKISIMKTGEGSQTLEQLLVCNVNGFFPPEIEVKWFRNGVEETAQVQSTELFHNGDWTNQIMVMLETMLSKNDEFICKVHHSSLKSPLRVYWKPDTSDAGKTKRVTGIVGFVLGAVFLIAGLIIYLRNQKVRTSFGDPQNESFIQG
ncbi:H-2 class II histocompatibility antigen, E-S beta chain-like isoform 2-T3 [Discoglossus pictus]